MKVKLYFSIRDYIPAQGGAVGLKLGLQARAYLGIVV